MGIASSRDLFGSCLWLSQGPSSYYLSLRVGFMISGVTLYSKGWRSHFFIINGSQDWGFLVSWVAHTIDNAATLSVGQAEALEKIREFFSSEAMERMKDVHAVEAPLPLAPFVGFDEGLLASERPSWAKGSSRGPSIRVYGGPMAGADLFEGGPITLSEDLRFSGSLGDEASIHPCKKYRGVPTESLELFATQSDRTGLGSWHGIALVGAEATQGPLPVFPMGPSVTTPP
ncbi:hypothetical protein B296_00037730 [Ensete ventricosum]|uniref:Uncharacterized protein n=1 Tax=Ensete ventricosum TaxID=4639 RepID=A0A426ZYQ1_ENSVE|nr:hypothetical protein B296_00037730 [Ensete ventricosum]